MSRRHLAIMCAVIALAQAAPRAFATVIGATVVDASSGDYTLTSVSVTRGSAGTFTYVPSQLIGVHLMNVDAFQIPLLVPRGQPLPVPGMRAALLEDMRLDTGIINITTTNAVADRSVEITFASPVVNSDGGDLLLFDLGGDDGIRFWVNDNRNEPDSQDVPASAFSPNLLTGMPYTLFGYDNSGDRDINGLGELGSTSGFFHNADSSANVKALGLDLSQVGVPLGGSITSLRFQSFAGSDRADPLLLVGLPAVPEPGGAIWIAAGLGLTFSRRRPKKKDCIQCRLVV